MVNDLDNACHRSNDLPEAPSIVASSRPRTGRVGRPRVEIARAILEQGLQNRPSTEIGRVLGCSARTVRRRALEAGIALPGDVVRNTTVQADGSTSHTYTSSTRAVSTLTDEELDAAVREILEVFPQFGRSMLKGRLKAAGHNVPRARLAASYLRVHGAPGVFGGRAVHRKVYSVAGANSLWHHDGQHGTFDFHMLNDTYS